MDIRVPIAELIPHVFLPLKLPRETSKNLVKEENHLLSLMQQTIADYHFIPEIAETRSLFDTWVNVQVNQRGTREAIRNLQPGQLFALYVRAQNCGLLISIPKQSPDDIIWSTFPASNKNFTVTGEWMKNVLLIPLTNTNLIL